MGQVFNIKVWSVFFRRNLVIHLQMAITSDMRVSVTELKINLSKYIERAAVEDIIITRTVRRSHSPQMLKTKIKPRSNLCAAF